MHAPKRVNEGDRIWELDSLLSSRDENSWVGDDDGDGSDLEGCVTAILVIKLWGFTQSNIPPSSLEGSGLCFGTLER